MSEITNGSTPAIRAVGLIKGELESAGVASSRDAGTFRPAPIGILIGLPVLVSRTLAARTYSVPVHLVSADPLNSPAAVDRLYALADVLSTVLDANTYQPQDWSGGLNADPLPSIVLDVDVTVFDVPEEG